jgi:prophage maintenance system killer protein
MTEPVWIDLEVALAIHDEHSLALNGSDLTATDAECVTTFPRLAAGDLTEEQLTEWIAGHSTPPSSESS